MKKELNTKSMLSDGKYEAMDIAKALLANDPKREYFTNDSKGHARLQHMLHISQMLYCSKTGKPLFKDPMYAHPPRWELLNKVNQKKLSDIYFNPSLEVKEEIKKGNKHQLIYDLYKNQGIEFDAWDEELFWGREEYVKRRDEGLAVAFPEKSQRN